jgi:hypothetical protein
MASGHATHTPAPPPAYVPSRGIKTVYSVAIFLGLLLFALGLMKNPERTWASYLTSYFYFLSLAMGAFFFTAIQHASNAGWSVVVRRISEAISSYIAVAAVGAIVLIFGFTHLYEWMNKDVVAHDPILLGKSGYLNATAVIIRMVIFFGGMLLFWKSMTGNSVAQDKDGNEQHTMKNHRLSIGWIVFFALSFSLLSVDLLMSLQPHWYSTIWGVYCFAGAFQGGLAVMVIVCGQMLRKGDARGWITVEHLHDLSKYMKAFTIFYAYIGFSQFLLIWYANLPEETIFYLNRSTGGWMAITLSLLIFKFFVPFLLMLPRAAKRSIAHSSLVACLILVMEYIDVHWMVYPNFMETWELSWYELGTFLMFGGLFIWSITNFLSKNAVVPLRDPRLSESLEHHVLY